MFCDFGAEFDVFDVNAEKVHTGIIASVTNCNPALLTCVADDERLQFKDGDFVVFSEVKGMSELMMGNQERRRM
jgi:ubiquitin-activating enzyme E1